MKIQIAVFDEQRSEMFTDMYEMSEPAPIPTVGDAIKIGKSKWFRVTDRKIIYEDERISVYLTGEPYEDPVTEFFQKGQQRE
jgi:hypothetical protein